MAGAIVALFIATGIQAYSIGIFLKPMTEDLGWSRASFAGVQTISTVVMGGLGFFLGTVVDRRGPRLLMFCGGIIAGVALLATSLVQELWQFIILRGIVQTIGVAMLGNLVVNVTVAKWFVARRGMAVALATTGASLGGVLMVPLVSICVDQYGWRTGWVFMAILAWVFVLPAALVMRKSPESLGLEPDGMSQEQAIVDSRIRGKLSWASEVQWTRREALRTRAIWLVIAAYGVSTVGASALILHMLSFLSDSGFSGRTAAFIFGIQAWMSLISKPLWGWMMDRYHARHLSAFAFTMSAIATISIPAAVVSGSAPLVFVVWAIWGFSNGGTLPLQETVWASYFGRKHLGEIRSVAMPFSIVFSAGGPLFAGLLYDRTGSYTSAFVTFTVLQAIGVGFLLLARPPAEPVGDVSPLGAPPGHAVPVAKGSDAGSI